MAGRPTKRDMIAAELRDMIIGGTLKRGEKLYQDEIAQQFSSSITPVREALGLLQAEGLLVIEPHRGVRIAEVDLDRLKAIYITRRLLETYAARRAVSRMSPRDIGHLESLQRSLGETAESQDAAEARRLNKALHFSLYEKCGLPGLVAQIEALWAIFPWDLNVAEYANVRNSDAEHQAIIDALRAHDTEGVGKALGVHLRNGFVAIIQRMTGEVEVEDSFDLDND